MAIIFEDNFVSATTKPINEHNPLWEVVFPPVHPFNVNGGSGTVSPSVTALGSALYLSPEFKSPNYEVTIFTGNVVQSGGKGRGIVLVARYIDENNYYGLEFLPTSNDPNLILFKVNKGTKTQLGSSNIGTGISLNNNSNKEFIISLNGNQIKVFREKVEIISVTDSSINVAGKVGIGAGIIGFESEGYHAGISISSILVDSILTVPVPPSNLVATVLSTTSIRLNWQDNSSNETHFSLERTITGFSSWVAVNNNIPANSSSFTDTGLNPNTSYSYRIRARNEVGNSGYSSTIVAVTFDNPPSDPINLTTSSVSSNHVSLVWADTSSNETGFRVERGSGGIWQGIGGDLPAGTTSFTDNGVSPGTSVNYRVKAFNASGESGYTNQVSVAVPPLPPIAPSGLTVGTIANTTVALSWVDNSSNEQGFRLERSTDGLTGWTQTNQTGANVTSITATGLTANTTYFFRIKAFNNGGESGFSNVVSVTTTRPVPAAPTINLTVISAHRIRIHWNPVVNATGYVLSRSLNNINWTTVLTSIPATATDFVDTGLNPTTLYYYRLQATNNGGNSGFSNVVSGVTLANVGQSWFVGDAAFNSGQTGNGFLDIFSNRGLNKGTETGPTIVVNRRFGNGPSQWGERASFGNLKGTFGYGSDIFGVAAGTPNSAWFSVDETNGIRIMHNQSQLAQWNMAGQILIGNPAGNNANILISAGQLSLRNGTNDKILLNANGDAMLTGQLQISGGSLVVTAANNSYIMLAGTGLFTASNGIIQTSITMPDGKFRAGGGKVILDATGLNIETGEAIQNSIKWNTTGGYNHSLLYGYKYQTAFDGNASYLVLRAQNNEVGEAVTAINLQAFTNGQTERSVINLNTRKGVPADSNVEINLNNVNRIRVDPTRTTIQGRIEGSTAIGARAIRNTGQSIANNTVVPLSFNAAINNDFSLWNNLNPTRLTAMQAGYYIIGGSYTFPGQTVGGWRQFLGIRINGGNLLAGNENHVVANQFSTVSVTSGMIWLNVGDYVELIAFQNSGAARTTNPGSVSEQQHTLGWITRIA